MTARKETSQSAPPDEFVSAWFHIFDCHCDSGEDCIGNMTADWNSETNYGAFWRAAFAAGAAAQAEKDARIAEGVLDLRISDGDQALDRVIEAIRAAVAKGEK